ncbi:multiheme c-type cytochrome [soil metagenome]
MVAGCESPIPKSTPPPNATAPQLAALRGASSNTTASDYVGPGVCGGCHAEEFALWTQSLHRVMNAKAEDNAAIVGDFANASVTYAGGEARFFHDATGYTMAVRKGTTETRYRVTRTIGRRGLQEYVGIEAGHHDEVRLPFGWWPRRGGWYAAPYFDPWLTEATTDVYAPVREPWAERCPWCHSTYPFAQRIARSSAPAQLGHGLEQLFTASGPREGADRHDRLGVEQQITVGISCESCHLGGRDHAAGGPIHLVPQGALAKAGATVPSEAFAEERRDPEIVNAVCAQCHSGPSPRLSDHTATRNSSEALDLAASPCRGIKCTDCHDPHRADATLETTRALAACTHCHDKLADPAAATAHAGKGHATTTCLDCHMPRMVMGIDHLVRTHRISSPTDPQVLGEAGPNACNLCHLDRSIAWTTDELAREWDVKLPVTKWSQAYPAGLDAAVGEVWLASRQPALRLIGEHAYAASPLGKGELERLKLGLADPLAYMRVWAQFAIEDVLGRTLTLAEFDARAEPAVRTKQLARLRLRGALGAR